MRLGSAMQILGFSIFAVLSNSALSQTEVDIPRITELVPLSEYLDRPSGSRVDGYPFVRCGGLFLGFKYYAGANLSETDRQQSDEMIALFRDIAISFAVDNAARRRGVSSDSFSNDDLLAIANEQWISINSIAFFYDDLFKRNYASDGAAFGEDEMVIEDFEICGLLAQ